MEQEQSSSSRPMMPRLRKMMSWSETDREEVWRRRKEGNRIWRQTRTVTDEDLDELKACMELGFGFNPNSTDLDPRLSDTLPALGLYCAVHKQYNHLLRTSSESSISTSSSDGGGGDSPLYVDTGEDPETVKARLKQWARVVACSVKQIAESPQI